MKRAEFDALCRREMEADGGEVTEVTLTADGLGELSAEALGGIEWAEVAESLPGTRLGEQAARVACGGRVSHVVHPVTRVAVPVSLGDHDAATVRHGPGGTLTRTVTIA